MPQVHLYIRNEDMDKWNQLENKSKFVHEALNPDEALRDLKTAIMPTNNAEVYYKDDLLRTLEPTSAAVQTKEPPAVIKTKDDAAETIKQLFPEAEFIEPLYRDKKKKKL